MISRILSKILYDPKDYSRKVGRGVEVQFWYQLKKGSLKNVLEENACFDVAFGPGWA